MALNLNTRIYTDERVEAQDPNNIFWADVKDGLSDLRDKIVAQNVDYLEQAYKSGDQGFIAKFNRAKKVPQVLAGFVDKIKDFPDIRSNSKFFALVKDHLDNDKFIC